MDKGSLCSMQFPAHYKGPRFHFNMQGLLSICFCSSLLPILGVCANEAHQKATTVGTPDVPQQTTIAHLSEEEISCEAGRLYPAAPKEPLPLRLPEQDD